MPSTIVKYNYEAQQSDELSLSKDARIFILEKSNTGWWLGQYGKKIGWFPSNHTQEELDNEIPISSAIVKYNYQAQQLDELSLFKDARILILEKSGNGWWRVQYDNKIGWFPSNYLQEVDNEDVVVNLEPKEIVEGQSLSNLELLTSDGNIVPANNALDVITEDLDISDDSDDDHEPMEPNHETKQPDPPPPSEEANAPNNASSEADDDFMMF